MCMRQPVLDWEDWTWTASGSAILVRFMSIFKILLPSNLIVVKIHLLKSSGFNRHFLGVKSKWNLEGEVMTPFECIGGVKWHFSWVFLFLSHIATENDTMKCSKLVSHRIEGVTLTPFKCFDNCTKNANFIETNPVLIDTPAVSSMVSFDTPTYSGPSYSLTVSVTYTPGMSSDRFRYFYEECYHRH